MTNVLRISLTTILVLVLAACVSNTVSTTNRDTSQPANNSTARKTPLVENTDSIGAVQEALGNFGYQPGRTDGIFEEGTKKAIRNFRRDANLNRGDKIDERLLTSLGILDSEKFPNGNIFVIDQRAKKLESHLKPMTRTQLVSFLPKLAVQDRKQIDLVYKRPKSIVFVVYSDLSVGDTVVTFASNIRQGKRNSWSQKYRYKIEENTPIRPLIIINEFETGNPMFIIHELFVNRKKIAVRLTRAN